MTDTLKYLFIAFSFFMAGILLSKVIDTEERSSGVSGQKVETENIEDLRTVVEELKILLVQQKHQNLVAQNNIQLTEPELDTNDHNEVADSSVHLQNASLIDVESVYEDEMPSDDYISAEEFVDNQIYANTWSSENAIQMMQMSGTMSHEQRTRLQHKIISAINAGVLMPEDITVPLF